MKRKIAPRKCDAFFAKMDRMGLALGYGDVLAEPGHSKILPAEADLSSRFSRHIPVKIPIISSPMDKVTEIAMVIAMAELGGLGIIHKNLTAEAQASVVKKAKHRLSAFVSDPICVRDDQTAAQVLEFTENKGFKFLSFPVINNSGAVVGVVSSRDFEFCLDKSQKISEIMATEIVQAPWGTSVRDAHKIMMENRVKILPIFNRRRKLLGIYTLADVKRIVAGNFPNYNLSFDGTLCIGAAIGVGKDEKKRMEILADAKIDVVVIDTAHGDSSGVVEMVRWCKKHYPKVDIVAGNVSTAGGAKRLARAGADGIRVGQGPGSICTTRIISGAGVPQVTAVYECAKALRGSGVPVCADGGIEQSGQITIALIAGASTVMLGSKLAGTTESPGEVITGPDGKMRKPYRGMGSLGAMKDNRASRARYGQAEASVDKLVPEGVEGEVPYKGPVANVIYQLLGGLRSGMGYCGAKNIAALQRKGKLNRITLAGLTESHPHGLEGFKPAPNYTGT